LTSDRDFTDCAIFLRLLSADRMLDVLKDFVTTTGRSVFDPARGSSLKAGVDFMTRYSSYGATNFRSPSVPTDLDPLKAEYRRLLELRERVWAAEEAALQPRLPRPSSTSFSLRMQ
jgi:hypothetical protein